MYFIILLSHSHVKFSEVGWHLVHPFKFWCEWYSGTYSTSRVFRTNTLLTNAMQKLCWMLSLKLDDSNSNEESSAIAAGRGMSGLALEFTPLNAADSSQD